MGTSGCFGDGVRPDAEHPPDLPLGQPTGAPQGNRNARRHGRYSAQSREIRTLGRILNRVADLARAQLAALEALACGDAGCIAIAEHRVSRCQERLQQAARSLDRVLVEIGDEDCRRKLVDRAMRLTNERVL